MKLLDMVKNFIRKKNTSSTDVCKVETDVKSDMNNPKYYKNFNKPIIENENNDKVLLLLDDVKETKKLYNIDMKNIERKYNKNVNDDFKIVNTFGDPAGYIAYNYIAIENNKIDYAILDIGLGYRFKLDSGESLLIDGIDIAIAILERNKNAKILFSTVHNLSKNNPEMVEYFNKFENFSGCSIDKYYLNKNSNRVDKIYKLLYEDT
jgi:hypothetical protein